MPNGLAARFERGKRGSDLERPCCKLLLKVPQLPIRAYGIPVGQRRAVMKKTAVKGRGQLFDAASIQRHVPFAGDSSLAVGGQSSWCERESNVLAFAPDPRPRYDALATTFNK
jgi:hypothetical protein